MYTSIETIITSEIRWFWEGKLPDSELSQMVNGPFADELKLSDPRIDDYFIFDRAATVGMKQREGKLEVKALVKKHEDKGVNFQVWEKRSVIEESSIEEGTKFKSGWTSVHKTRLLRRFQLIEDKIEEVAPDQIEGDNCQLEISSVKCNGKEYWSYCLECYAENSRPEDIFPQFYQYLKEEGLIPKQTSETAPQSYPIFLLEAGQES